MAASLQLDFGLKQFIEQYRLEVDETPLDGLTRLTLSVSKQTPREKAVVFIAGCGYPDPSIDVVLSRNSVQGAAIRGYPGWTPHMVSIAGERLSGYFRSGNCIEVCARHPDRKLDFEHFLSIACNPTRYGLGEKDAHLIMTVKPDNSAVPIFFSLGHDTIEFTDKGEIKLSSFHNHSASISAQPRGYSASKTVRGRESLRVHFPRTIPPDSIKNLDDLLASAEGWLKLPESMPVLQYA